MLVDARLLAAIEQGQARLQGDFVAGFVDRPGQALATGDAAVQGAQGFGWLGFVPGHHRPRRRVGVQAELGVLADEFFRADVEVAGGEFDAVEVGLAEVLMALEGEDVEVGVELVDLKFVAAVVEEGAR
ncbi:hypothetical protein ASE98_18715 [Pseudomonas sp. Leaf48]|nr:hypothetical protein ASE98_18715 [Pseudomonas sp. Leaf48]